MAVTGLKLDDGSMSYASNCFPVKGLLRQTEEGDGAWLTAHKIEQRKQFKAVLCAKPLRTYSRLKEERKRSERKASNKDIYVEEEETPVLDGFYLMKHCCVEDPADLCSINISGKGLSEVKEDDFVLFDNVAYVDAGENFLPFEAFRGFPLLRELELPLNGLRNISGQRDWFYNLEMIDLSYNNLSLDDILTLSIFPNVRVLHLTGNSLKALPPDMSRTTFLESGEKIQRFAKLEMLMLDDNRLSEVSAFAALAGLRSLKHLNLQRNQVQAVPQLRLVDNQHVQQASPVLPRKKGRKSASGRRSSNSRNNRAESRKGSVVPELSLEPTEMLPASAQEIDVEEEIKKALMQRTDLDTDRDLMTERTRKKREEEDQLMMDSFRSLQMEDPGVSLLDTAREPEQDTQTEAKVEDIEEPLPPPFPELRYLDLSHNQISVEEDLLAVAAWPMLSDLVIHDNPLTTQRSGDPPLLTRFLSKRLGINLQRKKPTYTKPHVEVPTGKPERKVSLIVPPIPKVNVEELLMLAAPPRAPSIENNRPDSSQSLASNAEPLPPIKTEHDDEGEDVTSKDSWDEEHLPEDSGDAFFMTQVDEPQVDTDRSAPPQPPLVTGERMPTPPQTEKPDKKTRRKKVAEKYKGYELLLDVEDDPGIVVPTDIQGNVRALDYTLKHPIKFRDNEVFLDRQQRPYKPFNMRTHGQGPAPVIKTKTEKVDEILENTKNRKTYKECDLKDVLSDSATKKIKGEFPEAQTLLSEVQHRYNMVRTASMKEVKGAVDILQNLRDNSTSK